jgi:hypothetical protein
MTCIQNDVCLSFFFKLHANKSIIFLAVVLLKKISGSIRYSLYQRLILGGNIIGCVLKFYICVFHTAVLHKNI